MKLVTDGGSGDPQLRRGRRRALLLMVAVIVGAAVIAALLGVLLPASGIFAEESRFWDGDPPDWAGVLGLVVCLTGLVGMVGGFWWLARSGYYRRNSRSRLWAESWSRRRHLVRQVRGTAAPRDEDRPLLPGVAEQLVDQPKFLLPFGGLTLIQVGQALLQWAPAFLLLAAILVVLLAGLAVSSFRGARQAEAFLAGHTDGAGPLSSSGQ